MYPVEIIQLLDVVSDVSSRAGSGSSLPFPVLLLAGLCTAFAVCVSVTSIILHLKNYRKPLLQRMVIRIMLMVPVYGIASLISLFSLNAAFFIDAIRDIYEAFVIYCFFNLLLGYLGGERSLLILLHGRQPKRSVFPFRLFRSEIDVSDPYMFLFLKRGITQYAQLKPILALATLILKAVGKYDDGVISPYSGYIYISIVYNVSICLSLYCLATFWMCVSEDLAPFRPVPKFLCVKGILFFSFWQSLAISMLVSMGAIKLLGPYRDKEHISLGLTDILICFEMPIFAVAHMYAFSHTDYTNHDFIYVARMPVLYAFRDAFGMKDTIEDFKATLRGEGINYREFEPAESVIHQGSGRDKRIRAGLRYAQGGQKKYWLPAPAGVLERYASTNRNMPGVRGGQEDEVYSPLMRNQRSTDIHNAPNFRHASTEEPDSLEPYFDDPAEDEEKLYEESRRLIFGDYLYPCIDASSEWARQRMWEEEDRILRHERAAYSSLLHSKMPGVDKGKVTGYGTVKSSMQPLIISGDTSDLQDSTSTRLRGKENVPGFCYENRIGSNSVIDKADNDLPAADNGIRLNWTKGPHRGGDFPVPSSRSRIPNNLEISTDRSTLERRSTPTGSTALRRKPSLPLDAVDLVQGSATAWTEVDDGKQKGKPVLGMSSPRIVRGGNLTLPGDNSGRGQGGAMVLNRNAVYPASLENGITNNHLHAPIARASTPPLHAQFETSGSSLFSPHEENPWL